MTDEYDSLDEVLEDGSRRSESESDSGLRYETALKQINELETELSEFQQSSYELEQELEKELNSLEEKKKKLEAQLAEKQRQVDSWKQKYVALEHDFGELSHKNEEKFKNYKLELKSVRSKLINIEIMNDNIEQNERMLGINLDEIETKYNDSLEKIALLESEVDYKDEMLLKERLNHQNTKTQLLEWKSRSDGTMRPAKERAEESRMGSKLAKSNSIKQLQNMIEHTKCMENKVENIRRSIRPSKTRKVSGRDSSIIIQTMDDSMEESIDVGDGSFYSALSKSTTNDSLNHSKAKSRKGPRVNLQKPPIQPLKLQEFLKHLSDAGQHPAEKHSTVRRSSGVYHLNELDTIEGLPNKDAKVTGIKKSKGKKRGGLLPSLMKFNINES